MGLAAGPRRPRHLEGEVQHQGAQILGGVIELRPEGGRRDEIGAQAVVQILPEAALVDGHHQIAVGGRHHLAVEPGVLRLAEALKGPALEHPEQLHLDPRIQLPDLVEEDRAVGAAALQPARSIFHGPGEGPPAVAEQLRLDEGGGHGREVQGVKRAAGIVLEGAALKGDIARQADGLSHQLLAGARGAEDQGGEVGHALEQDPLIPAHIVGEDRLPDRRPELHHRRGGADDCGVDVGEGPADLEHGREAVPRILLRPGQDRRPRQIEQVGVGPGVGREERHLAAGAAAGWAVEQPAQLVIEAVVEQVQREIAVELAICVGDVRAALDQPGPDPRHPALQGVVEGEHVGVGRAGAQAGPHRAAIHEG